VDGLDWAQEETSLPAGPTQTTHLWEESWDDDDGTSEEFAKQLREELKKMGGSKSS
jgi:26 proteasome complex subunit DSS1